MAPSPEITSFWHAFSEADAALRQLPLRERVERSNELLERHLSGLALELSGKEEDAVVDLIVTAHGNIEKFPLLMQVTAAAPALPHYRLRAFRERTAGADFAMGMTGFELATSDVLLCCSQDQGQIALDIRFAREIDAEHEEHARNMAFIMMDHVLGEYDFAVKVGAVDFVDGSPDPQVPWTPLSAFTEVFDAYWRETLGRTGHFPPGEPEWAGMTLSNRNGDDDADEDDADEDGSLGDAVVMVNRSANAVAMRADLAHALTLEAPVGGHDALAAAQDLHEQAATLLALSRTGIAACTVTRAGTRQALFYVSDEAQAREALAPLLARKEAASQELTTSFDPAWAGYFEYAAYLD
jgi:hypothetical protein